MVAYLGVNGVHSVAFFVSRIVTLVHFSLPLDSTLPRPESGQRGIEVHRPITLRFSRAQRFELPSTNLGDAPPCSSENKYFGRRPHPFLPEVKGCVKRSFSHLLKLVKRKYITYEVELHTSDSPDLGGTHSAAPFICCILRPSFSDMESQIGLVSASLPSFY